LQPSFICREREIALIADHLDREDVRLLPLTDPPWARPARRSPAETIAALPPLE
jgi:hypothetical protein